jgi:hypothetical protein
MFVLCNLVEMKMSHIKKFMVFFLVIKLHGQFELFSKRPVVNIPLRKMSLKSSYIELRTPSSGRKIINRYFDPKDNPDNLGFVRCRTCYERFPGDMNYESRIEHLKLHANRWEDFMNAIERSVIHDYNNCNISYDDPRRENDLKLSNGIKLDQ